jgi:viroplasmin and RNaseH domain-containing protein
LITNLCSGYQPDVYSSWAACNDQVSGLRDNCYQRFETKAEAKLAFDVYMRGATYEEKVEHEVHKREAEVVKGEEGSKPITSRDIVIAVQFVIIVVLCYVVLRLIGYVPRLCL